MAGELHDDIREGRVESTFVLRVWAKSSPVGSYGRTCSQIADEIERLRAIILDIARIVENPDDRALQRVRDVTDKHSSLCDGEAQE